MNIYLRRVWWGLRALGIGLLVAFMVLISVWGVIAWIYGFDDWS